MKEKITVALVGNPNCGKTSLFNALTGAKQHVGNWAGVTVDKKEGKMKFDGRNITIVDLPGTYSLGAYSEDEIVARNFILDEKPDVIINVVDSTNMERNLYLTVQLLEMSSNVILAMNMMDEAESKQIKINAQKIQDMLGITCVGTVATKKKGLDKLMASVVKQADKPQLKTVDFDYGNEIGSKLDKVQDLLKLNKVELGYPNKWTAIKLIENDNYILEKIKHIQAHENVLNEVSSMNREIEEELAMDSETILVDKRYDFISKVVNKSIQRSSNVSDETISDKIDKFVTNKWLGIPFFAVMMFFMYQITMAFGKDYLGEMLGGAIEGLGEWAQAALTAHGAADFFVSFIVDGIIGGMGSVMEFVPLLLVLYFLISLLEDSGYMARAAYVMDRFMTSIGLHGKTAISMIIGSGCSVAGIMSTRTMESKKDRMIAMLINPFVSCSARLPVYAVFAGALFGSKKMGPFSASGVVIFSLYVIGIMVAILMGKIFSSTLFKGEPSYFVMELPPYRIPTVKSVLIHMWEKVSAFLKKAGTIIFAVVVIIWLLSNLPAGVEPNSADSILGKIGSVIAPIFKPAGFGTWQAGVALFTGILAKEAVVATLGTVYGVGEAGLNAAIQSTFTPLTAYAFMIMTLLYTPCAAAIAAVKRETNSAKWAWFAVLYTFLVGWIGSVLVYQIGKMLGLG